VVTSSPRCFVIAEAGVNHNGSVERALQLVDAAADSGADAVKFQTFRAEALVGAGVEKAAYQQAATGGGDQLEMLRALELDADAHVALLRRCAERGIEFMSTPFDEQALDFLVGLGMRRVKIPSGELTNRPFLRRIAATGLPLILSTGMGTLDEVREALDWIRGGRPAQWSTVSGDVTVLHCTSSYPAAFEDVNLLAMRTIAERLGVAVGYSDHTLGVEVATAAVALGAVVIEKHFTLDRSLPGPDHAASLEVAELAAMVRSIRAVEAALGDGVKAPRRAEIDVARLVRRSVAAAADRPAGHVLTPEDLTLLRPGTGIPPRDLESVIGRRLARPVARGRVLTPEDFV